MQDIAHAPAHSRTDSEPGVTWNVLGHAYTPRIDTQACYAWLSVDPPGTFVPPHSHGNQDEHVYVLEGEYELFMDGQWSRVGPGDSVCWPQGSVHGYRIAGDKPCRALFWVSPAGELSTLFSELHEQKDPARVVELSRVRSIFFAEPSQVPDFHARMRA